MIISQIVQVDHITILMEFAFDYGDDQKVLGNFGRDRVNYINFSVEDSFRFCFGYF